MDFPRLTPGQPIRTNPIVRDSSVANAVLAATAAHVNSELGRGGATIQGQPLGGNRILIQNQTDEDLKRGQVLQYSDYLLSFDGDYEEGNYDLHRPIFQGIEAEPPYGKLAVLVNPMKAGDIDVAYIDGVCPLMVDGSEATDPQDQRFAIHNGGFTPVLCECGTFELLQRQTPGTSDLQTLLWARFMHTGFVGRSTEQITSSGHVNLWGRNAMGTLVNTGIERLVYNNAGSVAALKWVQLKWVCRELFVDVEDCS